jgi:hypothetical protein
MFARAPLPKKKSKLSGWDTSDELVSHRLHLLDASYFRRWTEEASYFWESQGLKVKPRRSICRKFLALVDFSAME